MKGIPGLGGPFGPPSGGPLGPGALGDLLRAELGIEEDASVLNEAFPHGGHIDAILYRKFPNGRVYPIDKLHLKPDTLTEM